MKPKYLVTAENGDELNPPEICDSIKSAEMAVSELFNEGEFGIEDIHVYVITGECTLVAPKAIPEPRVKVIPPDCVD